tara:strand:+ start:454 stop:717 length:264 start_codon:yes stop_codon:yes gene_type:complete
MANALDVLRVQRFLLSGEVLRGFSVRVEDRNCDVCDMFFVKRSAVVDCHTRSGRWANLCLEDFEELGTGLGVGRGQVLLPLLVGGVV